MPLLPPSLIAYVPWSVACRLVFVCFGLLLGGCYFMQSASQPIPTQIVRLSEAASGLVVMLPGFGDGPQDFIDSGFVASVRDASSNLDVVAVNAHWGYYRDYTVVERLRQDVIQPALERYDHIWLVGISMGGFGAAAYAQTYPQHVEGLILLAPFMGSQEVVEQVLAAGALADWVSPDLTVIEDVRERRFFELWQFYQGYAAAPDREPRLYIGFGDQDHLRPPNQHVASVLDAQQSLMLAGGHKWTVWKPLFRELSERAFAE